MDAIHQPDARSSWISAPFHIGSHMDAFSETVMKSVPRGDLRDCSRLKIKHLMKIKGRFDDETFEDIEGVCDIENLTVDDELSPMAIDADVASGGTKFRPSPIPAAGLARLESLRMANMFATEAGKNDKARRQKMSRHQNDNLFQAEPERPAKVSATHVDKEVT